MRVPRLRITVEWVPVARPTLRSFTIKRAMLAVVVLALLSKGGVWLYREWPRPYRQYIRIRTGADAITGETTWQWHWFDMRRPDDRARLGRLKAELQGSHKSWGWGRG